MSDKIFSHSHRLRIKDLGIDTYRENIIYIRSDSHVCKSEGFTALTRMLLQNNGKSIVATLNVVTSDLLSSGEAGLSKEAMKRLDARDGDLITISHLQSIQSLRSVRAKIYNQEIDENAFEHIIRDIVAGHYSSIEIAAFVTACAGNSLSVAEMLSLTRAMISSGKKISWDKNTIVLDKHCVGGLPGNRTTPIVVSIIASAGLLIPKTSSRSITSPAGTADTMQALTCVDLSVEEIMAVVKKEKGCFVWGGAVKLSPADDLLIAIEKALDIDSVGQMVASVLSKKIAVGSTHVVIDIPVGPTAKVRSHEEALKLQYYFQTVGKELGIHVEIMITDGSQPVGRGIGPSLEAMDVLAVLRNEVGAPLDLKNRSIAIAATLLRISGSFPPGTEIAAATQILENGDAFRKFKSICQAQGEFKSPRWAKYKYKVLAQCAGVVKAIDNRQLAKIAKLAGAPRSSSAGILFEAPLEKRVVKGDVLFTIYAESNGELAYAIDYLNSLAQLIDIKP